MEKFAEEWGENKEINFHFDNIRRRIITQTEDDLFDIEKFEEKNDIFFIDPTNKEQQGEVEHLSQKLNQLTTMASSVEKQLPNHPIPNYLSNKSKEFEQMIITLRKQTGTTIYTEELRDMACLLYELECIELDKQIWLTCLHSGQGILLENKQRPSLFLWPSEMKLKMIAYGQTKATHPNEITEDEYIKYVENNLNICNNQITEYQTRLNGKKQKLGYRWIAKIHETLKSFIEQYDIVPYRLSTEKQIIRMKYDFIDVLCRFEFSETHPNIYQKQLYEYLIQKKFDKEKSKLEVNILKQRLTLNYFPKSFEQLIISMPTSIDTIMDKNLAQHLKNRSEKISQQTKSNMMEIYMAASEARANQYRMEFDNAMNILKENERIGPRHRKFTTTMSDIMLKHFNHINEHLIATYKLKLRSLGKL